MATRYGNGGSRGRRITDFEDEPMSDEVEKAFNFGAADKLRSSFNRQGKEALARRAHQVYSRANRADAGETRVFNRGKGMGEMEASERGGLGRAGRKRGYTRNDVGNQIEARRRAERAAERANWRVEKGWGSDLTSHATGAARKAKMRAGLASRAKTRVDNANWNRDYPQWPNTLKRVTAKDDFARRSNKKSINFVERFKHDPESGSRRLANPKYKTSPPRQRSLTSADKDYLGFSGGSGHGTGQGVGRSGGSNPNYQFTGNKRVRKFDSDVAKAARYYDPEHNRQRRLGAAEAGLAGGGTAAMAYGIHGAVIPTKNVRALAKPPGGVVFRSAEEIKTYKAKQKLAGKTIAASPKHIAAVGAGAAAVAGAGLIHHKAKSISADRKHGVWR